jgi:hypothetical protein
MHLEITSTREQVSRLRAALLSTDPESVAPCLPGLQDAVADLRRLQQHLAAAQPPPNAAQREAVCAAIRQIRSELKQAERLIRSGSDFWLSWAQLMGMDTGYTPAGIPGLPEAAGQPTPFISEQG